MVKVERKRITAKSECHVNVLGRNVVEVYFPLDWRFHLSRVNAISVNYFFLSFPVYTLNRSANVSSSLFSFRHQLQSSGSLLHLFKVLFFTYDNGLSRIYRIIHLFRHICLIPSLHSLSLRAFVLIVLSSHSHIVDMTLYPHC